MPIDSRGWTFRLTLEETLDGDPQPEHGVGAMARTIQVKEHHMRTPREARDIAESENPGFRVIHCTREG